MADSLDDVELTPIFSKDHLLIKRLGSSDMGLEHDYHAGIAAVNAFLQT
ncbi:hypothetical protein [Paraglaciecola psychrophila]|nr:hypothetical protein [Paraglaciecola psychrophila]